MDLQLALMCGTDIPIPQTQIIMHQPRIKDIALIGEKDFFIAIQTLNINKKIISQDESLLNNTNNFQIFMTIMSEKETISQKKAVEQLFTLIFPNYKIIFSPRSLIFIIDDHQFIIDENNFDYLQDISKEVFCFNNGPMDQQNFNPVDKKATEIARKLMRGRERVAKEKGGTRSSVFSQYLSTLTVGISSMSLNDCMNLTMYQLFDLVERYSLYISWDIDIRSRLAGAKPDSKPDNWMKNIH